MYLLVELVTAKYQIASLCSRHSPQLSDINFGSLKKIGHWAGMQDMGESLGYNHPREFKDLTKTINKRRDNALKIELN